MVNPTGYTALDLIGFTDKGTYLSSENYVKNDLVHNSGNIWRCLIDDTSGIAPAEGVNWTLFIGEPTNLVERIIAPVETDPATNAYAVGRQFIYNDKLYEVIVAITAGDSLVTYEDDPTNANIKLADPVETQLLNEESARAAADLALQNALSHRNLLDNAWFTVNQRGESSYSTVNSYSVDRWRINNNSFTVEVVNDGLKITHPENSLDCNLVQYIEADRLSKSIGKTVTLSIMLDDGTIHSASGVLPEFTSAAYSVIYNVPIGNTDYTMSFVVRQSNNFVRIYSGTANAILTIKAIKLELGSISTLAMDTAPNYAEELLKCQGYFQRLGYPNDSTYEPLGSGFAKNANLAYLFCSLKAQMRSIPTVTLEGKVYVQDINIGVHAGPCTINASTARGVHALILYLVPDTANQFTAGNAMTGYFNQSSNGTPNSYIDLSADL